MDRVVAAVGDRPAVTKSQQQVVLNSGMVLSDSPGILWPKIEDESAGLRLALGGVIPDTAIDYLSVATFGAELFLARYPALVVARFKLGEAPGDGRGAARRASAGGAGASRAAGRSICTRRRRSSCTSSNPGALGRISLETP